MPKIIFGSHWPCRQPEKKCEEKRSRRITNVLGSPEWVEDIEMNQMFSFSCRIQFSVEVKIPPYGNTR